MDSNASSATYSAGEVEVTTSNTPALSTPVSTTASNTNTPPVHLANFDLLDGGSTGGDTVFESANPPDEACVDMESAQPLCDTQTTDDAVNAMSAHTPATPRVKRPNLSTDIDGKRRKISNQVLPADGDATAAGFDSADDGALVEQEYVALDNLTTCETAARHEKYKCTPFAKMLKSRFDCGSGVKQLYTVT